MSTLFPATNEPRDGGNLPVPIDAIRVEPLFTKMPVHQLAKRGGEEIRIIERNLPGGQVSLYWKVEPNAAVGHPGQLAYKLDTLVINRRLDTMDRPIPRLVRIGDLREMARELGLGGDTNAVKRAFMQNASAFIRAKVAFRTKAGSEETLEGYFNRYNVFFRGQKLPGGPRAESVYLSFNDPYYDTLNKTPWRPLDYEYLKLLKPAAQRFYELLSTKIYSALKNGHPEAWIRYSEYCLYAVQKRHDTRRRMQIQMAPVHRPHLKSGYLENVRYHPEQDQDGKADWLIYYTPGPKARAEYETFNGTPLPRRRAKVLDHGPRPQDDEKRAPERPRTRNSRASEVEVGVAQHFSKVFHEVDKVDVAQKDVRTARELLARCGDCDADARAAIELAYKETRDWTPPASNFRAVLSNDFPERAVAWRKEREEREARAARERAQLERQQAERAELEQLAKEAYAALPDEERERWIAEAKEGLRDYLKRGIAAETRETMIQGTARHRFERQFIAAEITRRRKAARENDDTSGSTETPQ